MPESSQTNVFFTAEDKKTTTPNSILTSLFVTFSRAVNSYSGGDSTIQQRKDKVYPALCSFCTQPHNTVWGALLCEVKCSVSNMTQQVFSVLLYQINIPLFPQTALSILAVTLNCVSNEQLCFFKPDGITGLSRAEALWFPAFGSEFSVIAINLRTVSGDVNNRKIQKSTRAPLRRLQRLYIK